MINSYFCIIIGELLMEVFQIFWNGQGNRVGVV
jgi:hypothetical protein